MIVYEVYFKLSLRSVLMSGIIGTSGEFRYAFLRCEAAAELAVSVFVMLVRSIDSRFDSDYFSGPHNVLLLYFLLLASL